MAKEEYNFIEIIMDGKKLTPELHIEWDESDVAPNAYHIPPGKATIIYLDENDLKIVKVKVDGTKLECLETYDRTQTPFQVVVPEGCQSIRRIHVKYIYLTKITVPSTLEHLGYNVFANCFTLEEVIGLEKTRLTIIPGSCFHSSKIRSISLPSTLEKIGGYAFSSCRLLSEVIGLKNTRLRELGENCFSGCRALKHVDLPPTVKAIRKYAFSQSGVETLTLPRGIQTLEALLNKKAFGKRRN